MRPGPIALCARGLAFECGRLGARCTSLAARGAANAYNILAAVATAMALDVPFSATKNGIRQLSGVPGVSGCIGSADDVRLIVDTHTPTMR